MMPEFKPYEEPQHIEVLDIRKVCVDPEESINNPSIMMLVHACNSKISGLQTMQEFETLVYERFTEIMDSFDTPGVYAAYRYNKIFIDACKSFKFDKVVVPNMLLVYDKYIENVKAYAVLEPTKTVKGE